MYRFYYIQYILKFNVGKATEKENLLFYYISSSVSSQLLE